MVPANFADGLSSTEQLALTSRCDFAPYCLGPCVFEEGDDAFVVGERFIIQIVRHASSLIGFNGIHERNVENICLIGWHREAMRNIAASRPSRRRAHAKRFGGTNYFEES